MKIKVKPFPNPLPDKTQVCKIGEEAMEVFSAWENWYVQDDVYSLMHLLDECADVIQATCNLIKALDFDKDFQAVMDCCTERNERRGRYDVTEDAER